MGKKKGSKNYPKISSSSLSTSPVEGQRIPSYNLNSVKSEEDILLPGNDGMEQKLHLFPTISNGFSPISTGFFLTNFNRGGLLSRPGAVPNGPHGGHREERHVSPGGQRTSGAPG